MEIENFCSLISTIPQYQGTCWFNAILMTSFYSQMMRKLMINKVSKTWDKENKLFKFFKTILKKNYNTEDKKIIDMFYRTRPETLIIKYSNLFNKNLKKDVIKYNSYGGFTPYISIFLKNLNVKILDITYLDENNKCLLNFFKHVYNIYLNDKKYLDDFKIDKDKEQNEINKILIEIPDVLIVYNTKLDKTPYFKNYSDLLEKDTNINIYDCDNYDINKEAINDIKEHQEEIRLLDNLYKLDSIILTNYNKEQLLKSHAISGITCNNNKYIYNGWCKGTNDAGLKEKEKIEKLEPLSLIKYDWNLKRNDTFCFRPHLSKDYDYSELCFSFDKGNRILIYVKNNNEEISSIIRSSTYSSLSSKRKDFKDFFKDIELFSYEEIVKSLIKKEIIFNKSLDIEILRKILINTLKKEINLLKKDKKYEYFTSLPIKNYKEEELIKIENNYYLKKNLFYYLFVFKLSNTYNDFTKTNKIITPDKIKIPLDVLKELIFYYFETKNIKEIYQNYIINNKINERKLKEYIDLNYNFRHEINNSKLSLIFVKLYGIYFFTEMLDLQNLNTIKDFLEYISDEDNIDTVLDKYNELNITYSSSILQLIKFLIEITKNFIDNIPDLDKIRLNNITYDKTLIFYYHILYEAYEYIPITNIDRKKIIFEYFSINNDYNLLIEEVLKYLKNEKNKKFRSNLLKNIKKIIDYDNFILDNYIILNKSNNFEIYKKINETTGINLETNETEDLPLGSIKGGKKKSLKRYLKI